MREVRDISEDTVSTANTDCSSEETEKARRLSEEFTRRAERFIAALTLPNASFLPGEIVTSKIIQNGRELRRDYRADLTLVPMGEHGEFVRNLIPRIKEEAERESFIFRHIGQGVQDERGLEIPVYRFSLSVDASTLGTLLLEELRVANETRARVERVGGSK